MDKGFILGLVMASKVMYFRATVYSHLCLSSAVCFRRFSHDYLRFLRLLMIHSCCEGVPLSGDRINGLLGSKMQVVTYMMVGCGWLSVPYRKHTLITPKGEALVRACVQQVERDYSTFWVGNEGARVEHEGRPVAVIPVKRVHKPKP